MGKKHKHPEHENLERWLVSYADFITLLFATFVVLYALSQADLAKFKEFSKSVKQAFNPAKSIMKEPGGVIKGNPDPHILKDSGNSLLKELMSKQLETQQQVQALQSLAQTVDKLNAGIVHKESQSPGKGIEDKGGVTLKMQERGIVVSFASSLFFDSGSATLKPQAFAILNQVAPSLIKAHKVIHVEGHTDNLPIRTQTFPSNWELSAARASSVLRYLVARHGFDPNTMAAVGYAHTRPVANNAIGDGRRKNRRVDIVLLSSEAQKEADAGAAQKKEAVVVEREAEKPSETSPVKAATVESPPKEALPKETLPKEIFSKEPSVQVKVPTEAERIKAPAPQPVKPLATQTVKTPLPTKPSPPTAVKTPMPMVNIKPSLGGPDAKKPAGYRVIVPQRQATSEGNGGAGFMPPRINIAPNIKPVIMGPSPSTHNEDKRKPAEEPSSSRTPKWFH